MRLLLSITANWKPSVQAKASGPMVLEYMYGRGAYQRVEEGSVNGTTVISDEAFGVAHRTP